MFNPYMDVPIYIYIHFKRAIGDTQRCRLSLGPSTFSKVWIDPEKWFSQWSVVFASWVETPKPWMT